MLVYVPTQGEGTGVYNEEGHERLDTCTQNFKLYIHYVTPLVEPKFKLHTGPPRRKIQRDMYTLFLNLIISSSVLRQIQYIRK